MSRAPRARAGSSNPAGAFASLALAACVSIVAPASRADETRADVAGESNARELFKQGNQLIEQARYADALDRFTAAYAAWQNPKIQLNIATTLRTLGRHAEALRAYREYLATAEASGKRRAEVEAIITGLEARVGYVALTIAPRVQRVTLDGNELERASLGGSEALAIDPGRHVLVAETEAGPEVTRFEISAGEREAIALSGPAPSEPAKAPTPAAAPEDAGASHDRLGLGVVTRVDVDGKGEGAVGALGLAVPIGSRFVASAGGLIGAHGGGWVGLEALLLETALTPTLGVSAPFFFVDGLRLGVSAELGGRWAIEADRLFLMARAAIAHFPRVPQGYSSTALVPSLGAELRW